MILIDDIGWITCQEMTDVFEGFTTHGDAGIDGAGSDVGGEYDILQSVEGFCDVRFVFEDIQGCTCYLTFFQYFGQCLLIDNSSPGCIDENGCRFHQTQFTLSDQVPGSGSQGGMKSDEVGFPEQGIQFDPWVTRELRCGDYSK